LGFCEKLDTDPTTKPTTPTPTQETSSGTDGQNGQDGESGQDGSDGSAGVDGEAGTDGTEGEAGLDGVDGTTGAAGAPGAPGSSGSTGPAGPAGEQGEPGPAGEKGDTGATGATGPAGPCTYLLDLALIDGNLVPSADNTYTLGSPDFRWKDLQLGPGTLFIEDQTTGDQVGITVVDGALLLDGADSLRIGNVRLTATGLESILSDQDITIGNLGDTGYVVLARGLKFPDGTIQSTAASGGAVGPQGPQGPVGPQGEPGSIGEFKEEKSCVETPREETTASVRPELMGHILLGTCEQNRVKGTDIVLLLRVP